MGRPRSLERDKAFELWKESRGRKKLKEIAAQLGIPDSRVRKWKTLDKWDERLKGELRKGKGCAPKRRPGAPQGNKNALGNDGGAPPGNKNALKHGIYENIIRERLTPEEQAVFDAVPDDDNLMQELRILRFKLLRLLEPVERQALGFSPDGAEVVTIKVDEVTKAYAIEKLADGIRKIVKEIRSTGDDDGSLTELIRAIRESEAE